MSAPLRPFRRPARGIDRVSTDWLQELRALGERPLLSDMFLGSEAYLETWERANGSRQTLPAGRGALDLRRARALGAPGHDLPSGAPPRGCSCAGQPSARPGRSCRYCTSDGGGTARGGARFLYGVRAGQVRWVAAASGSEAANPRRLRADLRAAGLS